jgi:hypothetical protein
MRTVLAFALVAGISQAPATPAPPAQTPLALVMTFADGHKITRLLKPTGEMWTPAVRILPGRTVTSNGLPVTALHVAHVVQGDTVVVTVALLFGSPHQVRTPVATVDVTARAPVRVDALEKAGVEAVTFSIAGVSAAIPYAAAVESPSLAVSGRFEAVSQDTPTYRFTIANASGRDIVAFRYEAFAGDRRRLSAMPRGARDGPLVAAGGEHTIEVSVSASSSPQTGLDSWQPLDRVVITGIVWGDGTTDGDPSLKRSIDALRRSHARQLRRVLEILRGSSGKTMAVIRDEIQASADPKDPATVQVTAEVLADIRDFVATAGTTNVSAMEGWLRKAIGAYEEWLQRSER